MQSMKQKVDSGFSFADVTVFDISIEDLEMRDFVDFFLLPCGRAW